MQKIIKNQTNKNDKLLKYEEFKKGLVDLTPEEYEEAIRLYCIANKI